MAMAHLRENRPDVVFSTGGYSAGPVVAAAKSLRIPYVIHEANSVPGRSNLVFASEASSFTCVFKCTERLARGVKVTRTGQPIRPELRDAADGHRIPGSQLLILGGSQGSEFLNEIVPEAAAGLKDIKIVHATGRAHIDSVRARVAGIANYDARPYLDTTELVDAYRSSSLVIARSGGTLAEIAMFGLPSILVPLPTSADDHQLHNAIEFDAMEAATLLPQPMDRALYAEYAAQMANHIEGWMADGPRRERAKKALLAWDIPDATQRIARLVQEAAAKHAQI
jgi:UDP-N-acetylglucosamine--N-acetylmuramyl-(pentapeptide) pyrophosphoryl-undecaprenol N-acetylglucosamine transferase